jgi:protein phosphatase
MSQAPSLKIVSRSDTGRVRDHNEDNLGYDAELGIVVLADGLGGYRGGEVASAIAVDTILAELRSALPETSPRAIDSATGYSQASLLARKVVIRANEAIYEAAQAQPQYQGMGTTVVMAVYHGARVSIAHVGDSRIYRVREGVLELITVDHTLLQELVDRGFYTPEEARTSLNRNLVTRALGIETSVAVDVQEELVLPGDLYVFCSDGLNDMLEDEEILLTIKSFNDNLEKAAEALVQRANERGGKDNVSVVLTRIGGAPSRGPRWLRILLSWFRGSG